LILRFAQEGEKRDTYIPVDTGGAFGCLLSGIDGDYPCINRVCPMLGGNDYVFTKILGLDQADLDRPRESTA
jgi:hypothetical protein